MGGSRLTLPKGSPKDKAAASNQTAREAKRAKPQCAFMYQSPTPHEGKITSRQSGFALQHWHANPEEAFWRIRVDKTHRNLPLRGRL